MSSPGRLPRRGNLVALGLWLSLAAEVGCAASRSHGVNDSGSEAVAWIEAPLTGEAAADHPEALAGLAAASEAGPHLVRLDRLIDLYDAARFGGDATALDTLWRGVGRSESERGADASREFLALLLQEAWATEDLEGDLPADHERFLADLINLLSVDLNLPADAEALSIQTLAYRQLAREGHPRIADNARWRLYDHVRGVLAAAVAAPPLRAGEIAAHALYATQEDISPLLSDDAPHARPTPPSPEELWKLLAEPREALHADPRWRAVVDARAAADGELHELVLDGLPQARDPSWSLPRVARGTGRAEGLGPVLLLAPGRATLRPTSPAPRVFAPTDTELTAAIEAALARDGRGLLLLAADPLLPAPDLHASLTRAAEARVDTIEFALLEPRLAPPEAEVVVALPLHVARGDDPSPAARELAAARVHLRLEGRGPLVALDGRWLARRADSPSDLAELLDTIRLAYPHQTIVGLSLADDVSVQQLTDLLAALVGGPTPRFAAVGWQVDARPSSQPDDGPRSADALLALRAELGGAGMPAPRLEQPFSLAADDQRRLEEMTPRLATCLPELERRMPRGGVAFALTFDEGRLADVEATAGKLPPARAAALVACTREVFGTFRLRAHRDRVSATVSFDAP